MRLYDRDFNHLYSFSEFSQLQAVLKYYGKSNLAVAVDEDSNAAHFLQVDNYINFFHNSKSYPFIIKRAVLNNGVVTVQAVSPHELFERRITIPPDGAYAVTGSGAPDKVVKDFIRACTNGIRALPFQLEADKPGTAITETSRLKNLGDEVSRICEAYGIGESFTLDSANKCIVFDTYAGADRTRGNIEDNPPCEFAEKYHNLIDYGYDYDTSEILTTPVVAGGGEGEDREFLIVGENAEGLDRYEALVDARDVAVGNTDLLRERGTAKIKAASEAVTTTENQSGNLVFGVDYDLGDLITVRFDIPRYRLNGEYFDMVKQKLRINQRVSEVTISIEGGAHNIDIKYGDIILSKSEIMRRDVEQLKSSY